MTDIWKNSPRLGKRLDRVEGLLAETLSDPGFPLAEATKRLVFSGGDVIEPLKVRPLQAGERKQGTTVRAWPDAKYFESPQIPVAGLVHVLRSKAVLLPGTRVTLTLEKSGQRREWHYESGLRGYLGEALGEPDLPPLLQPQGYVLL